MKPLKTLTILIFIILIKPVTAQDQTESNKQIIDGVAAIVADNIILKSELAQIVNLNCDATKYKSKFKS